MTDDNRDCDPICNDPVVRTVKDAMSRPKLSMNDSLRVLKTPYVSSTNTLLGNKDATMTNVHTETDPELERAKAGVRRDLRDLYIQRIELTRQMLENKISQQDGNDLLNEMAQKKNDLTDKLRLLEEEQEEFKRHMTDLNAKNEELKIVLDATARSEAEHKMRADHLAQQKAELAKKLADVAAEHIDTQNVLSQLGARRMNLSQSVKAIKEDANTLTREWNDLQENRSRIADRISDIVREEQNLLEKTMTSSTTRDQLGGQLNNVNNNINDLRNKFDDLKTAEMQRSHQLSTVNRKEVAPPALYRQPEVIMHPKREYQPPAVAPYPSGYIHEKPPVPYQVNTPTFQRTQTQTAVPRGVPVTLLDDEITAITDDPGPRIGLNQSAPPMSTIPAWGNNNNNTNFPALHSSTRPQSAPVTSRWKSQYQVSISDPALSIMRYGTVFPPQEQQQQQQSKSTPRPPTAASFYHANPKSNGLDTYERSYGRRL